MDKLRVVMIADSMKMDGISTVIINYCTHLNLEKFKVTIMAGAPVAEANKRKCAEYGIQIVELPERKKSYIKFCKVLNRKLREGKYDICHVHGNSATKVTELMFAWRNHICTRVMHCHTTRCQHIWIHRILSPIFKKAYNRALACSIQAGEWIFGKNKFVVLPNAFEVGRFAFNPSKRKSYRKELDMEDAFVLGFVGRLNDQKNYWYALKCFEKYLCENPRARLLIVGDGAGRDGLIEYVNSSSYKNKITVYGESDDVSGLLSAMDVFLFPSCYEGLGIAAVEAQISGIPCIISDAVPREVRISEQIDFLPIGEENISLWVDKIRKIEGLPVNREVSCRENRRASSGYDIKEAVKFLEHFYTRSVAEEHRRKKGHAGTNPKYTE